MFPPYLIALDSVWLLVTSSWFYVLTCIGRSTKLVVFNRLITWAFRLRLTRKEPSRNLFVLLWVPAIAWKPYCMAKGDSLCREASTLADFTTRNLGHVTKRSYSESESVFFSLSFLSLFRGILWAMLGFMWSITLSPHPPPSPTRECICKRISSKHTPGL